VTTARRQTGGVAELLQLGEDAAGSLVANEVRDVALGHDAVLGAHIRQWPCDVQRVVVLDRDGVDTFLQGGMSCFFKRMRWLDTSCLSLISGWPSNVGGAIFLFGMAVKSSVTHASS